jgi:hypothetical protein
MLIFLAYIIGLLGTLFLIAGVLTYIVVALTYRPPCPVRVAAAILCGYIAGALFVWTLVPSDWTLPFWTTLAATVNGEKYGQPVEHAAEAIFIWVMFGAVVGAVGGGSVIHIAGRLLRQRRVGQEH